MATYTSNYAWTKPSGNDQVDISVLNDNLDSQDAIMHKAFTNMAQAFSELSTYAVGDIVLYDNVLYKCHTAVTVAGAWTGSANWQVYKLSEGGGGGTSNYNDLTNKPSVNGVTLSGNKTTSDLGINADNVMLSDDVTSVADAVDGLTSGLTNVIAKSMFGGYSKYYRTTQTSIDGIVDNSIVAPQTDDTGYFSAENKSSIVGYGSRQFVFGWVNTTKLFAWIVICSFDGIYVGRRANASAFTITKISD